MGRLTAGALACAALLFAGCGSHGRSTQLQIRVDRDPFRISIVRGGDTVVSQDEGARLRYQLAATGVQHQLTKVLSSKGNVYRVATNEPAARQPSPSRRRAAAFASPCVCIRRRTWSRCTTRSAPVPPTIFSAAASRA